MSRFERAKDHAYDSDEDFNDKLNRKFDITFDVFGSETEDDAITTGKKSNKENATPANKNNIQHQRKETMQQEAKQIKRTINWGKPHKEIDHQDNEKTNGTKGPSRDNIHERLGENGNKRHYNNNSSYRGKHGGRGHKRGYG